MALLWIASGLILLALYVPVLIFAVNDWISDDNHSYCLLILPVCAWLAWSQRVELRRAERKPTLAGLLLLLPGLLLRFVGYKLGVVAIAMWSLPLVITGMLLMIYGPALVRMLRFPLAYLFFAGPLPAGAYGPLNAWIQSVSTTVSVALMHFFSLTVANSGNRIEVPGLSVEVADVCSGFRKLTVLIAFVVLFTHLTRRPWLQRLFLIALTVPVAIVLNSLRIFALVAVAETGGVSVFHIVHAPADFAALLLAFLILFNLNRVTLWKSPTFSH